MPGIGFLILAVGSNATLMLDAAELLMGLSMGAEMDVAGYLVMRFFRVDIYSTVYGLMAAAAALSGALGSVFLSAMLKVYGSFGSFFLVCGILTLSGSGLFLLLSPFEGRLQVAEP
jgi:MFS family permease